LGRLPRRVFAVSIHPQQLPATFSTTVEHIKFSPAPEYLNKLQLAIRQAHGCEAVHERTWMGVEHWNQLIWSGSLEVFRLEGHPTAKRAYTWARVRGDQLECYIVLGENGVNSPRAAVKHTLETELEEQRGQLAA